MGWILEMGYLSPYFQNPRYQHSPEEYLAIEEMNNQEEDKYERAIPCYSHIYFSLILYRILATIPGLALGANVALGVDSPIIT